MANPRSDPVQTLAVYRAADIVCTDGPNLGASLSFAAELLLDDIYQVRFEAALQYLSMVPSQSSACRIAETSAVGGAGAALYLDSVLTFMARTGQTHDALLLVEVDREGGVTDIYLSPLLPLLPSEDYRLIGVDTKGARHKLAQVACVSFAKGTHITMASGAQRPIEGLQVGETVLTRDDGAQQIRWIGQHTVRAVGAFAPICIEAGALNNAADLTLSPEHRLFIYQREDAVGVGRAEIMVKARDLVNGQSVRMQAGGFVDYFQLLFDRHQIIYAEGIAAESMLIEPVSRPVLPETLTQSLGKVIPGHTDHPHDGLDVTDGLLDLPDAAETLRKASTK